MKIELLIIAIQGMKLIFVAPQNNNHLRKDLISQFAYGPRLKVHRHRLPILFLQEISEPNKLRKVLFPHLLSKLTQTTYCGLRSPCISCKIISQKEFIETFEVVL